MMAGTAPKRVLDLTKRNPALEPLIGKLNTRIVGQPEAQRVLVDMVSVHLSGLGDPEKPAGNALFLGPTGTGKTYAVESMCEGLVGDKRACIKIDCAEFQHGHEIAKLVGSPPGYLGHRETHPMLTQEALNQFHKPGFELSVLLLDEIEKASDSLWQLLLGILDKATLTLGDNRKVDFCKVLIIMTSNLGAKQMNPKGFGFKPNVTIDVDDAKISTIAKEAAKRHFTPEFMNRLEHIVTFKTLTEEHVRQVMQIELGRIQQTMLRKTHFVYQLTDKAKDRIIAEGYSTEYGARALKRKLDQYVRLPLSNLIMSGEIADGNAVVIDDTGEENFEFSVQPLSQTQVRFKDLEDVL